MQKNNNSLNTSVKGGLRKKGIGISNLRIGVVFLELKNNNYAFPIPFKYSLSAGVKHILYALITPPTMLIKQVLLLLTTKKQEAILWILTNK